MEFVKKCWRRHLVINAIVCTLSFAFSLPISLALFPQQSKVFFFFFSIYYHIFRNINQFKSNYSYNFSYFKNPYYF